MLKRQICSVLSVLANKVGCGVSIGVKKPTEITTATTIYHHEIEPCI